MTLQSAFIDELLKLASVHDKKSATSWAAARKDYETTHAEAVKAARDYINRKSGLK